MSKIREKESLECVRMHIWASKTQKLPGPLSGPWTPATECSLRSRDSASLCRQLSASEAGDPPWPNPGSAPECISVHYPLKIQNRITNMWRHGAVWTVSDDCFHVNRNSLKLTTEIWGIYFWIQKPWFILLLLFKFHLIPTFVTST